MAPHDTAAALAALHTDMRSCRICLDAGHAITAGAVFRGGPGARVMLIGQAPGNTEVTALRPFNAGSGRRLFQWLGEAGWSEGGFRDTAYMTAVTKCYPGTNASGKGDRVPSRAEQALCRPFLEREIQLIDPFLLILVGGLAIKLLYPANARLDELIGTAAYFPPQAMADPLNFDLSGTETIGSVGDLWDNEDAPASSARPTSVSGRYVVPLPHPSGASLWPNKPENQALIRQATELLAALRERYSL
jgi:uracil-DNA glycosylase